MHKHALQFSIHTHNNANFSSKLKTLIGSRLKKKNTLKCHEISKADFTKETEEAAGFKPELKKVDFLINSTKHRAIKHNPGYYHNSFYVKYISFHTSLMLEGVFKCLQL